MGDVRNVEIGKTYEYRMTIEINGVEKFYRCEVVVREVVGKSRDRVIVSEVEGEKTIEVPLCRLYEIETEADRKRREERGLILKLALMEASRKRDECVYDVKEIVTTLEKGLLSENDRERYTKDEAYLRECVEGWEETIREIKVWQNELDRN